jgi:hypothetical protein
MHHRGAQEESPYAQEDHSGVGSDVVCRLTRVGAVGARELEPAGHEPASGAGDTRQLATAASHTIDVSQEAQEASQEARIVEGCVVERRVVEGHVVERRVAGRHVEELHTKAVAMLAAGECVHARSPALRLDSPRLSNLNAERKAC